MHFVPARRRAVSSGRPAPLRYLARLFVHLHRPARYLRRIGSKSAVRLSFPQSEAIAADMPDTLTGHSLNT